MRSETVDAIIFLLVVGSRFIVPLFIPRFPLPAIVASLVIDAADQTIFDKYTNLNLANYQSYDKSLDIYYLTVAYLSVIRNWTNGFALEVARFLWYYRLIGVVLFEVTGLRALLFVFPNTFEYFFIAYEVVRTKWDPRRLTRSTVLGMAALIWVFIKLPQEWWIHIAQNDFTDFVHETLFGVEPGTSLPMTFTNRPWVALTLVLLIGIAAQGGRQLWRSAPTADWSFRFKGDKPTPNPDLGGPREANAQMMWPVWEKISLITLVTLIFGQMLELEVSAFQVFSASALVVVANVGISLTLARRGTEWRSLGLQFIVLAAVNSVVLSMFASLIGSGGFQTATAVFFGMLLTLIIVMYDRFRALRETQEAVLLPHG